MVGIFGSSFEIYRRFKMARVNHKVIITGVERYAPFTGALIVANDWNLKFKDKTIKYYKAMPTVCKTHKTIIKEVLKDKSQEGIILGGLDWSLQIKDMVALVELAVKNDLRVLINVPISIQDLQFEVGKYVIEKSRSKSTLPEVDEVALDDLTKLIGATYLDTITGNKDFYLICGLEEPKFYWIRKDVEDVGTTEKTERTQ